MKRYQFSLGAVLRVRKIEEDRAVAAFADAERARLAAEAEVERRALAHQGAAPSLGTSTVEQFLAARDRHERTARAALAANDQLAEARSAVVARRAALAAAASARGALEQLDERRRAEHALEALREETVEADDLVNGRYLREQG